MTQQPTAQTHPKLKTSKGTLVMYELVPNDDAHVNFYESQGSGKPWVFIATMKKEYARHSWNYLIAEGGVRIQD